MSSHDDPEQRIRELERSLSERTAELTQSSAETGSAPYGGGYVNASTAPPQAPYTAPPPYTAPLPSYNVPFPTVQMSTGGGAGRGWLVVGVMTVIMAGIAAGALFYFSNVFSSVSSLIDIPSSSPTVSGGGGPFGEPPSPSGAYRPQITTAEPTVSSAPPGSNISVSGVGANRTIECNDGMVNISGVSNTVVLTGHCVSVTISGVENLVTIDEADTISASGFDNRVTYRIGAPNIQNSGGSNVVEQG